MRDVVVDVEPLDAVVDLEQALAAGAPRVHEHLESNAAAHVVQRKGDYDGGAGARRTSSSAAASSTTAALSAAIENRAVVAQWDAQAEELTIWDTTQAPIPIRNGLAARLGLLESQVRVVAPFVGGGFGPKIMMFYPEELLVPVGVDAPRPAGQVDRGPAGELLRDDAGARAGPRRRNGADARRADPRRPRRLSSSTPAPTIRTG